VRENKSNIKKRQGEIKEMKLEMEIEREESIRRSSKRRE
jgi:hypothetical protein